MSRSLLFCPLEDESTDIEFDACHKMVGGSHLSDWSLEGHPEEIVSGKWVGGRDELVPKSAASACPGIWTVVYSFTETFTNKETLTAEESGSLEVTLPPGAANEELEWTHKPFAELSADLYKAANAEEAAEVFDKFGYAKLGASILNNC